MRRALGLGRARGDDARGYGARARGARGRGADHRWAGRKRAAGAAAAGVGLAVVVAACGASTGPSTVGTTPVGGGTVTYALAPASYANYIFPFVAGQAVFDGDYSVYNVNNFQWLLYRPLYWFGKGTQPFLNPGLSLAHLPKYKGQQVTIRLKSSYKWSDGEPVDARDVVFWMNMMLSQVGKTWAAWSPQGLPNDVSNVHAAGKYTVSMTIKGQYSEPWFTYNELSQITPMPLYWDRTASGPSHCATVISDCVAVYNYLAGQAKNPVSYGTSKIWSVVDGPWRVQSYTSQGTLTLVYNRHYSGPAARQHISKFVEVPFTSEPAEYNVLQNPTGNQAIDVGYLPTVDAPVPPGNAAKGPNPSTLPSYKLNVVYPWQISYYPYNFRNKTVGPIFQQQYFRTAFQSLVDQEGVIEGPLHGYGKPTIGPVGDFPVTSYLSPSLAQKGDQWPLSPAKADSLLTSHGWSFKPGGTDTCISPGRALGDCGAGIRGGTPLNLNLVYPAGTDWMESQAKELASNANEVGIHLTVTAEPFQTVINDTYEACTVKSPCSWELADWGSWTYAPDFLPTGEQLFASSAINNVGGYTSHKDDQLIQATLSAKTPTEFNQAMYAWQDFLATQLPVVYQPDNPSLVETINNLHTNPWNSALTITPEDWYYLADH